MHDYGQTTEAPIECSFSHAQADLIGKIHHDENHNMQNVKTCLKLTQDNKSNFSCKSSSEM